MNFAELCRSQGLEAPNVAYTVPELGDLVLDRAEYTIPVFAAFPSASLPLVSYWIEHQFRRKNDVFNRLTHLVPLLPFLAFVVEHFVAMHAEEWSQHASHVPGIIRLLVHDFRRYAPYFSSENLRKLAQCAHTPIDRTLALIALGLLMERSEQQISAWLAEYNQTQQLTDYEFKFVLKQVLVDVDTRKLLKNSFSSEPTQTVPFAGHSPLFTQIGNVCVPRLGGSDSLDWRFVATATFATNLQTFAHQLLTDRPLLLVGERGSGKTSIVEAVHAQVRTTQLVRIHLGDQTDAKALIGTYTTGAKLGTFEWTPGALTAAVQRGQWVLIEDIDRAPNEIVAVLLSLLTHRELVIPSRNQVVRAAPGFQILATTATNGHVDIIGQRSFAKVAVLPPNNEDLSMLIRARRPFLSDLVVQMLVTTFRRVEEWQEKFGAANNLRNVSTRDLVKLADRIKPKYSTEDMFREAFACFSSFLPQLNNLKLVIGDAMGIASSQIDTLLARHCPSLTTSDQMLVIGRAELERRVLTTAASRHADQQLANAKFALTPPTLRLMEEIAVAVQQAEPVLLVGETGTGKTTLVQHLAQLSRRKLVVINVSQQVETGDLIGGFKPVDARQLATPLLNEFDELFDMTFSRAKNHQFLSVLNKTVAKQQWKNVVKLLKEAVRMAVKPGKAESKRVCAEFKPDWSAFAPQIDAFAAKLATIEHQAQFQFVEGLLVRALRQGHWVLLDELNLAPADTLEGISELLSSRSLTMLENKGEVVNAHPQFRLFANMNPATDVGKRDLPVSVRAQFTELWSASPDEDIEALRSIVKRYLPAGVDSGLVNDVAQLYTQARDLAASNMLADGQGQRPHFSIRTLARMLVSGTAVSSVYGLRRGLYETFFMSFLTLLDQPSAEMLRNEAEKWLLNKLGNKQSVLSAVPPMPNDGNQYVRFQHWWMPMCSGNQTEILPDSEYILTPSVERNLLNLVRATALKSYPVLIQGPTSSGKTSMITYLAKRTGHTVVRINNHEHTDLAEYMGGYESDSNGTLVFKEGALVTALRQGHWLVLDELNLAPTDVLEALNRLLDDNRELLVPETQEVVKPHRDFVLFATQNPPGIYAGRKVLSRAFRNRFLELHFDDIPEQELEQIVRDRTGIAPSYAAKIVEVYRELSRQRIQRVFEQAATLRDLFRWAKRPAIGYEQLAFNGFCLLAERSRTKSDRDMVKSVIERVMRVGIDTNIAAMADPKVMDAAPANIVWTGAMKRILTLVQMAVAQNEPVLLVGETGCGKTTIIQALAAAQQQRLSILNAHQNTETGDLVGSQRPVRSHQSQRLFEWVDGPLVVALKRGDFFLLDEISLADDSVLERLNSVLEMERTLFVPEIGSIEAAPKFQFFSTMNPGGDYGKKELSPALRNRFTEIWVPTVDDESDLHMIVSHRLAHCHQSLGAQIIVEFSQWFSKEFHMVSLRDILSWTDFVNAMVDNDESVSVERYASVVVHGAFLTFIDGLGIHSQFTDSVARSRQKCIKKLVKLAGENAVVDVDNTAVQIGQNSVCLGGFTLPLRAQPDTSQTEFSLAAPTSALNAKRVVRAMQVKKPVLLEGSPGAGKTSLITALAKLCGAKLTRINLSDQTDLADLFGQDVPLEEPGKFGWQTAPFLRAMQEGEWVLLDEMNLAPQPVLEGLNACLDHRGEAYIPELDQSFVKSPNFTVFAAQNPQGQGGGRKGLPKSFINRFSVVYVDQLGLSDLHAIAATTHPSVDIVIREKLASFVEELATWSSRQHLSGGPFEFNLRDTLRWLDLVAKTQLPPQTFLPMVVTQRLRTREVRLQVEKMFYQYFDILSTNCINPIDIKPSSLQIGAVKLPRNGPWLVHGRTQVLPNQTRCLETALQCIAQAWPMILVGPSGSGKSSIIQLLAQLCGATLREFAMTSDIDSTDLLGEFDQLELDSERQQTWFTIEDEVVRTLNNVEDSRLADAIRTRNLEAVSQLLDIELHPRSLAAIERFKNTDFSKPLFKWVDGMLVRAVEQGDWLVLDNANLCSSAVLDRLNSLLERGGSLAVNECSNSDGSPREIKPHPGFRLFLTVNPKYGELSRAMRNRGVEIFLDESSSFVKPSSYTASQELPMQFSQPLTIARLGDLKNRTWLRSLALDSRTPAQFLSMVDQELADFSVSPYHNLASFGTMQENWLKFCLVRTLRQSMDEARSLTANSSALMNNTKLITLSALRRFRDSVECEFDVYGLIEYMEPIAASDSELFSMLNELAKVDDPSRIPVYRDWLLQFAEKYNLDEFAEAVRQRLGRQYDFSEGGAGMELIWQNHGRPSGFATEQDHNNYLELVKITNEFDELVFSLGLDHTDSVANIRQILSQATSVDDLLRSAIDSFKDSLNSVSSSKPLLLSESFAALWESLALVYIAQPSPSLFAGICQLTNGAKRSTVQLQSLLAVGSKSLALADVSVPPTLESVIINVLQSTQQGQSVNEVAKIRDMIVTFGNEFVKSIDAAELVKFINAQAWSALSALFPELNEPENPLDLAKQLLQLYVCPLPLDPAIAQHVWYERYIQMQALYAKDTECWQEMQQVLGSDSSELSEWLENRTLKEEPVPSIWRPKRSGIALVHRDMIAVAQIVMKVSQKKLSSEETDLVQRNADHLFGRLVRATGYRDLVAPVLTAISLLKLYLSCKQRYEPLDAPNLWLLDPVATVSGAVPSQWLSSTVNEAPLLVMRNLCQFPKVSVDVLDKVISSVHQTWTMDRLRIEEQQREQNSGFRFVGGEDEEAEAEREFKDMFPDFDEIPELPKHTDHFIPEFVNIYCELLSGASRTSLVDAMVHSANNLTLANGESSAKHLPALILALDRRSRGPSTSRSSSEINFYSDPSPNDADLSVRFADLVAKRMHTFLELWPEHDTLQNLARIAEEVSVLPPEAPIAMHLSKVEQLHHNLYEWDRFASKEHKVGDLMAEATSLIVRWRQLELATWPALFLMEKRKAAENAAPFWFHLYETLVFAPAEDLGSIAKVLVLFMSGSSIGQFSRRLQLLASFEAHLALYTAENHLAVRKCVANVREYFEQFQPAIQKRLDDLEKQLRKKVDEVVKLASWRDVNIHALKQSAQRSHRQLFKFVRKFRELLQVQVVTTDLVVSTDAILPKTNVATVSPNWVDLALVAVKKREWKARPARLQDLASIASVLDRYANQIDLANTTSLYEMASDIEQRAAQLNKETPTKWTKENKKEIAALKVEKQQLLTSTLRALKHAGYKHSLKKQTIESQTELTRVLATAANLQNTGFSGADSQFNALIELLPRLRSAVSEAANSETNDVPQPDLQRGLALSEDIFAHILKLRAFASNYAVFTDTKTLSSLSELAKTPVNVSGAPTSDSLQRSGHIIENICDFIEAVVLVTKSPAGATLSLRQRTNAIQGVTDLMSRTESTRNWFTEIQESLGSVNSLLSGTKSGPLLRAIVEAIQTEISAISAEIRPSNVVTDFKQVDETIVSVSNSVLVVVQQIVKLLESQTESAAVAATATAVETDEEVDDTNWATDSLKLTKRALATLRSREMYERFRKASSLIFALSKDDPETAAGLSASLMVFAQAYQRISQLIETFFQQLLISTTNAALKLSKLLFSLATAGFCSPQPMEDDDDNDEPEKGDGIGLGDGAGGESTSKDVEEEDEDVTEAMQTANPEQEEREDDGKEDNAKEMEGDMAGELEDAPPQDEEEEGDQESDQDMDEEVGELDDLDPNAVDEKMWDDQKPDTDEKEKQTDDKLDGSTNPDDAAEAGNEGEQKQSEDAAEEDGEDGDEEMEDEDAQDDQLGDAKDEDEQLEDGTEQKDALDLPDDMQLDGDGKEDEEEDGEGMNDELDDGMDDDEVEAEQPADHLDDPASAEDAEESEGEDEGENTQPDEAEADEGDEANNLNEEDDEVGNENDANESKPEDLNLEETNAEDAAEGDGQGADIEGLHGPTDQQDDQADHDQATTTENQTNTQGQGASEDASAEQSNLGMGGTSGANQNQPEDEKMEEIDQHDQQASEQVKESLKQLGDAMQQFHRRQQAIREHEDREETDENAKSSDPTRPLNGDEELEHVGAEDAFDTQALGKTDEQVDQNIDQSMAIDDETENNGAEEEVAGSEDENAERGGGAGETAVGESSDSDVDMEDEPLISANPPNHFSDDDEEPNADENDTKLPTIEPPTSEFSEPRTDLWQVYEAKTHDLALVLGEQLRLILEPTVASKLRGDYRTGKRLNMKRIIPYIASEFRKDKIWLRRTKPAKREYQILLALDDSKSMGEPVVVDLAFQAIALVGKALSSIEAGQVGIAKFGSDCEFVHSLDHPLTTQNGNAVLSEFRFNQQRTNVHQLLTKSLAMFAEHSSRSEQWKLEIIVSDGITDDHQTLRQLVRQAYDERVMIVFVVLDALNKENSVLDMNEVRYTTDESGNPKLEVVKYFEDFPFDYYVLVRNINDLPMVLANVLRQYFQSQQ